MLFLVFPLIFFAIFMVVITAVSHRRQEAVKAEQKERDSTWQSAQQPKPQAPVRPSVQPTVKPVQKSNLQPRFTMEGPPIPKKEESAQQPETHPLRTQESPKPALAFSGSDAVKGILYAEILGKPKALR